MVAGAYVAQTLRDPLGFQTDNPGPLFLLFAVAVMAVLAVVFRAVKRLVLWWGLAFLWSLLLLQALFPPDDDAQVDWVTGGIIWGTVLATLIWLGLRARRKGPS